MAGRSVGRCVGAGAGWVTVELGVVLALATMAMGAFWRVWALIADARAVGEQAQKDLAAFRERAAEVYATKDGMQRQTDSLLRAIESVGNRIDGLNERLDRVFEASQSRTTRSRSQ